MRTRVLFLVVVFVVGGYGALRLRNTTYTAASPLIVSPSFDSAPAKIDFDSAVKPILARCTPCHFSGGTMYERLPFDRSETVTKLGEKLFTRIQAENDRKIIREFLAQNRMNK